MQQRQPELHRFLASLHDSLLAKTDPLSPARNVTQRIMRALKTVGSPCTSKARRFPVCDLLDEAVHEVARMHEADANPLTPDSREAAIEVAMGSATSANIPAFSFSVVEHAKSILALSYSLSWWQRAGADQVGEPFKSGHINATVIGPGGLEERDDVAVGITLLASGVDYPVHHHPPEEVYLVLSEGQWNQSNGPWHTPGIGGFVHNPPNILHGLRSGEKPLLATWCFWSG